MKRFRHIDATIWFSKGLRLCGHPLMLLRGVDTDDESSIAVEDRNQRETLPPLRGFMSKGMSALDTGKLDQILEVLLAAGYFRVRISELSDFDKVVGGLCWCITSSGEDVDVDILFQENSTIGQRIKLSETIIMALRKMQCPHPLQAHQIQGSDYPAIYPVIRWLVKKFFETREVTFSQLRRYARLCFSMDYQLPGSEQWSSGGEGGVATVEGYFKPVRRYRRQTELGDVSEAARVSSCLLEYGENVAQRFDDTEDGREGGRRSATPDAGDLSLFERRLKQAQKEAEMEEEDMRRMQEQELRQLLQGMAQEPGRSAISGSKVGDMVGMQSEEIVQAAAGHDEFLAAARRQLGEGEGEGGQSATHERQGAALKKQIAAQDAALRTVQTDLEAVGPQLGQARQELSRRRAYNARATEEFAKLSDLEEKSDKQAELQRLKELVLQNETLKAQEAEFKASCKLELASLKEQLAAATASAKENDQELSRIKDVEELHGSTVAKMAKMRELLADRNLQVATTTRLIDDVPTRTELIQYERRFTELYDQVAFKLEETRKYYDFYNTLDSTRQILKRQVKLLTSISESFETALRNKASRDEFLRQFEQINDGVEELCLSKARSLEQRAARLDTLKTSYQALLDEQRKYFTAVKAFQDECQKHDQLEKALTEQQS